jgi:phosphoribosylaminoimidazolecarboxamide formyltransferase / IMP cyclohydrolase
MEISFIDGSGRQTLCYEKVSWVIDGVEKGLRYGENPGQEAAMYKLVNGNLTLGDVTALQPGRYLSPPTPSCSSPASTPARPT